MVLSTKCTKKKARIRNPCFFSFCTHFIFFGDKTGTNDNLPNNRKVTKHYEIHLFMGFSFIFRHYKFFKLQVLFKNKLGISACNLLKSKMFYNHLFHQLKHIPHINLPPCEIFCIFQYFLRWGQIGVKFLK